MSRSKFFGYVLRDLGTSNQKWVLSEIPGGQTSAVISTTSVTAIESGSVIPFGSVSLNQIGLALGSTGSWTLPAGMYKVDWSGTITTPTTGDLGVVTLQGGSVVLGTSSGTSQIIGSAVIQSSGCGSLWSLVNSGTTTITPVLDGINSFRLIVTRLV